MVAINIKMKNSDQILVLFKFIEYYLRSSEAISYEKSLSTEYQK